MQPVVYIQKKCCHESLPEVQWTSCKSHVKINQEAPEASGEAIMAKPNSMFYCSLFGGESFDEFAHLGSLREVIEHRQDEELRHLLRRCREGDRQDWPVEAMLNA